MRASAKTNRLLIPLIAMIGGVAAAASQPVAKTPPNVLILMVDDLNDVPSFMGSYPDAKTPNLDRLAAEGIVFANAHCQYPLCGPSRASFMSGLMPATLDFTTHMEDETVEKRTRAHGSELLYSYFAQHGYKTMAVGKVLHNHVPEGSVDLSGGRGPFNGGTGNLKRNWPQEGTSTDWAAAPESDELLPDYAAAQWAIERLKEKHDKPFLLMVGFLRPHVPWYVPQKWFDLYPDKEKLALPAYLKEDLDDIPEIGKKINITPQMPRTEWAIENNQWRNIVQAYLACVSFSDHYLGEVLRTLEASPYKDNTVIVLLSDNGYHIGEKNTFQKMSLWERSSHVPLVMAGPGIQAGQRCERIVGLVDLYPTLVEYCGLPKNEKNEGRSLMPLLKNPAQEWQYMTIISWEGNNTAIQGERYRYILYEEGSEELYDHQTDPNEWTNLAARAETAEIKKYMRKHIPETRFSEQPQMH